MGEGGELLTLSVEKGVDALRGVVKTPPELQTVHQHFHFHFHKTFPFFLPLLHFPQTSLNLSPFSFSLFSPTFLSCFALSFAQFSEISLQSLFHKFEGFHSGSLGCFLYHFRLGLYIGTIELSWMV